MPRYIDADKAKEEIKSSFYIDSVIFGELMSFRDGKIGVDNLIHEINAQAVEEAVDTLKNVETEDVAPVTHAHWTTTKLSTKWTFRCSNCNAFLYESTEGSDIQWKYCPDCGAKMDEEVK